MMLVFPMLLTLYPCSVLCLKLGSGAPEYHIFTISGIQRVHLRSDSQYLGPARNSPIDLVGNGGDTYLRRPQPCIDRILFRT